MKDILFYSIVIITFLAIIILFTTLVIKIAKGSKYLFHGKKYFGFTKISLSFKVFNTFFMRNFLIRPNVTYQVVYKLKTEEGKVTLALDDQLFKETTTSTDGSCLLTFKKGKPVLKLVGDHAKNGHAEVKLIKQ